MKAPDLLRVRRIHHGGDLVVLTVLGDVDMSTVPVLEHHLRTSPPPLMIVNLDQVGFFSAAGVGALIRASADAHAARRRLVVVALTRPAARILSLLHAERELAVFTRLADAIGELN